MQQSRAIPKTALPLGHGYGLRPPPCTSGILILIVAPQSGAVHPITEDVRLWVFRSSEIHIGAQVVEAAIKAHLTVADRIPVRAEVAVCFGKFSRLDVGDVAGTNGDA